MQQSLAVTVKHAPNYNNIASLRFPINPEGLILSRHAQKRHVQVCACVRQDQ
jgi:hypothetical protein